jgi:hypothetical protein
MLGRRRSSQERPMRRAEFTISKCPICGGSHVYDIEIERSQFAYANKPQPRSFTRLFACAKTGEMFQGTIEVSGYDEDVTVVGPHAGGHS